MVRICKLENCEKIVDKGRKVCSMHHQRWKKYKSFELPNKPDVLPGFVKACHIHGQLKPEDCLIRKRSKAKQYKNTSWNVYTCKACARLRYLRWRKKNPNKKREDYLRNRFSDQYLRTGRKRWLNKKFNMTVEEYEKMIIEQNGLCACCKNPETQINKKSGVIKNLSVDHCHRTGKIRQLLCNRCNIGLGTVNDSIDKLQKMIDYLRRHGATE